MREAQNTCPLLKEVVMLYCDACPTKKMLPLDHLVSARPCQAARDGRRVCGVARRGGGRLREGGPMIATVPLALLFLLLLVLNDRAMDRAARV